MSVIALRHRSSKHAKQIASTVRLRRAGLGLCLLLLFAVGLAPSMAAAYHFQPLESQITTSQDWNVDGDHGQASLDSACPAHFICYTAGILPTSTVVDVQPKLAGRSSPSLPVYGRIADSPYHPPKKPTRV